MLLCEEGGAISVTLGSSEGYRPDPADVAVLEKFRNPPVNVGELRSLLGFLGYYRCYVENFSRKVKPLYDMLKGNERWWEREAEKQCQGEDRLDREASGDIGANDRLFAVT